MVNTAVYNTKCLNINTNYILNETECFFLVLLGLIHNESHWSLSACPSYKIKGLCGCTGWAKSITSWLVMMGLLPEDGGKGCETAQGHLSGTHCWQEQAFSAYLAGDGVAGVHAGRSKATLKLHRFSVRQILSERVIMWSLHSTSSEQKAVKPVDGDTAHKGCPPHQ